MKFDSVYIKLTGLYVLMIMAVSLFFSALYYQSNVRELERGLNRQVAQFNQRQYGSPIFTSIPQEIIDQELSESSARVLNDLVWANLALLAASTLSSYALARKTLQPIEKAMDEQARFTADASHELRTPLTAMRAETEVALRDPKASAAELRGQLKSNMEEVAKLERLSTALLSLARKDADAKVEKAAVSVTEAWREAERKLAPQIAASGAEVSVLGDDLSVVVLPDTLEELFTILLENALKYSPEKPIVRLVIKTETTKLDELRHKAHLGNGMAVLAVEDHGQGISASDLPHIFERFYRADRSRRTEGHGLGLSIAQEIVRRSGGDIKVTSRPGKGTRFTIRLGRA